MKYPKLKYLPLFMLLYSTTLVTAGIDGFLLSSLVICRSGLRAESSFVWSYGDVTPSLFNWLSLIKALLYRALPPSNSRMLWFAVPSPSTIFSFVWVRRYKSSLLIVPLVYVYARFSRATPFIHVPFEIKGGCLIISSTVNFWASAKASRPSSVWSSWFFIF